LRRGFDLASYNRLHMTLCKRKSESRTEWSLAVAFLVLGLLACTVNISAKAETENQSKASEVVEDPWPHCLNIYTYTGSGGFSGIEFFKFSSQEEQNYSGGKPVLCKLSGWEQLPARGWLRNPQTGQSVVYAIQVVDEAQFATLIGSNSAQIQAIKSQLMAANSTAFYAELPGPGRILPTSLKQFMNELGAKWATAGLEAIESDFQPPVWRTAPTKSEIRRLSVEQWNQKALEAGGE
jgi:hypothetical protein